MAKRAAVAVVEINGAADESRSLAIRPDALLQHAVTSGAGIEVLEKLMALQERWEANQARKAYNAALTNLREKMPTIIKGQRVDYNQTHYQYEGLADITEVLSPILAEVGLSFRWRTVTDTPSVVKVTCIISHSDGHFEETTMASAFDTSGSKNNIQALGSAVTYLQRYTLKAALGVAAAKDDDGQSAGEQQTQSGNGWPTQEARRPDPQSASEKEKQNPRSNGAPLPNDMPGFDAAMKADMKAQTVESGHHGQVHERHIAHNELEFVMSEWCKMKNQTVQQSFDKLVTLSQYTRRDNTIRPGVRNVLELSEKEAINCRHAFEKEIKAYEAGKSERNYRVELGAKITEWCAKYPQANKLTILKDLTGQSSFAYITPDMAKAGLEKFEAKAAEAAKKGGK